MDCAQAMAYLDALEWHGSRPGLPRVRALLEALGSPQDKLRFVHIAGTNGKGSCAAMTASVLRAAGLRTGLFTSPYLQRFNERMQINGEPIPDDTLAELVTLLAPLADAMEDHPTAFEFITALALLWFQREGCDIVVLEVGLGGRLDATNVIDAPEAAVIMNIGLDHTDILGGTVELIAAEKAGIIKPGCEVVLYPQQERVERVIRARCEELGVTLHRAEPAALQADFDSLEGQAFRYRGVSYAIPLLGEHQLLNAAVVIELARVLAARGWPVGPEALERGLYAVQWPARFEPVRREPWFILDGGHNPQCARAVAAALERYFPDQRRVLLVGVLADKDYPELFRILDPVADAYVCVAPNSPRALSAEALAEHLRPTGKPVTACDGVRAGVETALALAEAQDAMVCAVGSLYMAGEVRNYFDLK